MRDLEVGPVEGAESEGGGGDQRRTHLAIAASHLITSAHVFQGPLLHALLELPPNSLVLLRRPRTGSPGWIESVVAGMTRSPYLPRFTVEWFEPEPGGRDQTYRRDFELVEAADQVIAFFDAEHIMEGGTAHVVEAAMMRNIPVSAWSIDDRGLIERVGELDRM